MAKDWVQWIEPFEGSEPVYMLIAKTTAIARMRRLHPEYPSDEIALQDFLAVNWAYEVEAPHGA